MTLKKIAVVGTGMSALGSILALVEAGIKPTVIDAGSLKDTKIPLNFNHLKELEPKEWTLKDHSSLIDTLRASTRNLPQKLSFGSADVYGTSQDLYCGNKIPPYSHFMGGFSQVWGGSALVTPREELRNWPIEPGEMDPYFEKVLKVLPYAANSSKLDLHFGKPAINNGLKISKRDKKYLDKLEKKLKGNVFVGQSRLLVHSRGEKSCRYCGYCMTGCSYSSIFKSSEIIEHLSFTNKINLLEFQVLNKISEKNGIVQLELNNKMDNMPSTKEFDKVYLAAGAAETSRIILNSTTSIPSVTLHGRGSCVVPLFSFSTRNMEWPFVSTLPAIFVEFLDKKNNSWAHIQITNQNELIYKAFGLSKNFQKSKMIRFVASNISTLMINDNSQYGVKYTLSKSRETPSGVYVEFSTKGSSTKFLGKAFKYSLKIAYVLKVFPLLFFTKINRNTYHLGGSFPMSTNCTKAHETDKLGRIRDFENVHLVDSSAYPSMPSTTLGILLTANAWRIVENSI